MFVIIIGMYSFFNRLIIVVNYLIIIFDDVRYFNVFWRILCIISIYVLDEFYFDD